MQTLRIEAHPSAPQALAPITLLTGTVLTISILSGFQSTPVPHELAWQFSPIGFLTSALKGGLPAEYLDLPTANYFRGPSGLSLDYATVFFKTCFLEAPFYAWCLRREGFFKAVQLILTANFLTHPIVFFVFPLLFARYVPAALSAEVFAAGAEMLFIGLWMKNSYGARTGWISAFIILFANLFSWEVGMFV
ncbi:MAG: hypothetical protein ACJ763_01480 [Bdellovibrionia bacterium]